MYSRPSFIGQYNIRKGWLDHSIITSSQLNSDFDEPTYLSFKLNFYSEEDLTDNTTYDSLPQSLFSVPDDTWLSWTSDQELREKIANYSYNKSTFMYDRAYSAVDYLLDKNEDFRAFLLCKFIKGWYELQEQYQFYFQSVSGIDEFFKSDPTKGQKLNKDVVVTIECLEGIDQRVKYLLTLYKTAAWDDEYQRWILPDIFRYFKFDIFISEIRTFQRSNAVDQGSALNLVSNVATNLINKALGWINSKIDKLTGKGIDNNAKISLPTLNVLNGICPVTCIHCEMCDFDINSNWYQSQYTINNSEPEKTTFKVRVKKSEVIYNWTLIDRIFGNLFSNTERGKKSVSSSTGWRDYLGMQSGPMAQDTFNGTNLFADADMQRNYSGAITGGWITDAINKTSDALNKKINGGGFLDLAADIYNTVKSAVAGKNTTKDITTLSKANNGGNIQLELKGDNSKEEGSKTINNIQIQGTEPDNEKLKKTLVTIAEKSNVADERTQKALDILKNYDKQFKDLTESQQRSLQEEISQLMISGLKKEEDRSKATDLDGGENVQEVSLTGITPNPQDLTPIDEKDILFVMTGLKLQSEIDRSKATDLDGGEKIEKTEIEESATNTQELIPIINKEVEFKMSPPTIQKEDDRSKATDLDGGENVQEVSLTGIIPNPQDLTPIDEKGLVFKMSTPTIQKEDDRSKATNLDGEPNNNLVPIKQPVDKSFSTDLDGEPIGQLTSILQPNDKSLATDLDGQDSANMTEIVKNDLRLTLADTKLQKENDKSLATDLDGQSVPNMSSIAISNTQSTENLTPIQDRKTIFHLSTFELQSESDRSKATDLDGQESTEMVKPKIADLPISDEMVSIVETSVETSLVSPQVQSTKILSTATNPETNSESNMNGISQETELNTPKEMSPIVPTEYQNESIMFKIVENLKKTESVDIGYIDSNIDRSLATDLDETPNLDGGNLNLFDKIAKSQATSQSTIQKTDMINNKITPTIGSMVVLTNGKINPDATVRDILDQYTELSKNPSKKEDIEKTSIVENNVVTKTIQKTKLTGNSPKNKKIQNVGFNGDTKKTQNGGKMTKIENSSKKTNKKIKSVL